MDTNPALGKPAFACPHCRAHAQQKWYWAFAKPAEGELPWTRDTSTFIATMTNPTATPERQKQAAMMWSRTPFIGDEDQHGPMLANVAATVCFACERTAIWVGDKVLYPVVSTAAPMPSTDLPDHLVADYLEAGAVLDASPRSAAALLRLVIEKLLIHLGESGTINSMIGSLVAKGVSPKVQKALDVIRVFANESVHPGTLQTSDDRATALSLFSLVNIVCETLITEDRKISEMFAALPPAKLAAIQQRDEKKGA